MNIYRHWFLWSAVEVAPHQYRWKDYDLQLDLAAKYGMKTIIAEMITAAPEWAFRDFAHARYEKADGSKVFSNMSGSCVTGGFPGLCLDNDDALSLAERFLTELVNHYRDHPGLGGYDIWNECSYRPDVCYCSATRKKFRLWLKQKYCDLEALGRAWYRYSYRDWDEVEPPRILGPYPDTLDWLRFRIENAYSLMRWRVELIRKIDPEHPITAHGVAGTLNLLASSGADDWRAAAEVDIYGYTWGACRHGNEPWKQWHAVDLARAASRGKAFWHAEAYAGPLWMQPQVLNKPRSGGRIAEPEDIRIWDMVSFAAGATGLFYLRWRPLLDGPLFGAFGPYGMDGSRTSRSEMASKIGKWVTAPAQKQLWKSRPVKGDVGILVVPETQLYCYAQQGNTDYYRDAAQGAYQGFFDNNIQADWIRIENIDEYGFLYLPFPVMLTKSIVEALRTWVEKGGKIVIEGCPAYFGDLGKVGTLQPNLGLDKVLGAVETYVEFTPDLLDDLFVNIDGVLVRGGVFMQTYQPTTGEATGWYDDGSIAAVDNQYVHGRTRLVGTFPSVGYARRREPSGRHFFASLMDWAGKEQHIRCSDTRVTARLHDGVGGTYLWLTNPTRRDLTVKLYFADAWGLFVDAQLLWGEKKPIVKGRQAIVTVGEREAVVCKLES